MKKLLSLAVMLVFGLTTALAQAEIKFDKVTQDLGTFGITISISPLCLND